MKRNGWSISEIAGYLVRNWKAVKKHLNMTSACQQTIYFL